MKVPIPSDWDGEKWACVKIDWPDSPEFWGLLNGLLTLMTRGRYWDEGTGTIKDIQGIAWGIWNKNYPFRSCSGVPIDPPGTDVLVQYLDGGCLPDVENCEDDMGCVLPYGAIKMIDGVLHYKTCEGFLAVEGWDSVIVAPPPTGTNPDPDDPSTWACNKAHGIATSLVTVMQDTHAAISPFTSAYDMVGPCYQVVSTLGASWGSAQLISYTYVQYEAEIDALIGSDTLAQKLACLWSPVLQATDNLSNDEYLSLLPAIQSGFSVGEVAWINAHLTAVGYPTLAWWSRIFHDSLANCDCPANGEPLPPVAGGWYLGELRTMTFAYDDVKENSFTHQCMVPEHDVYGLFHWGDIISQSGGFSRYGKDEDAGGCAHDVQLTAHAATSDYSTANINAQMDDQPCQDLYDAMGASRPRYYDLLGPRSKVIPTPVMDGGQTGQVMFFAVASSGGSGIFKVSYRLVHNNLSPSHS